MPLWLAIALMLLTQVRDAERHWSATPPPGWTAMPAELVETFNSKAARLAGNKANFRYTGGYIKNPGEAYPYILIQFTPAPLSGATYEDLERGLGSGIQQTKASDLQNILSDLQVGVQKLDRVKGRLYLSVQADVAPAGRMQGLCVGFLGRGGIVQFNCYSKAAEFEADLPTYERFVGSFTYDPGYAFTPRASIWKGILSKAAIGALIGVLLGGAHYFRRKKAAA